MSYFNIYDIIFIFHVVRYRGFSHRSSRVRLIIWQAPDLPGRVTTWILKMAYSYFLTRQLNFSVEAVVADGTLFFACLSSFSSSSTKVFFFSQLILRFSLFYTNPINNKKQIIPKTQKRKKKYFVSKCHLEL